MNFVHFLVNNPRAQETATVAVDIVDSVLDCDCVDYHIFKHVLKMVHLVKLQAAQLPRAKRVRSGGRLLVPVQCQRRIPGSRFGISRLSKGPWIGERGVPP